MSYRATAIGMIIAAAGCAAQHTAQCPPNFERCEEFRQTYSANVNKCANEAVGTNDTTDSECYDTSRFLVINFCDDICFSGYDLAEEELSCRWIDFGLNEVAGCQNLAREGKPYRADCPGCVDGADDYWMCMNEEFETLRSTYGCMGGGSNTSAGTSWRIGRGSIASCFAVAVAVTVAVQQSI